MKFPLAIHKRISILPKTISALKVARFSSTIDHKLPLLQFFIPQGIIYSQPANVTFQRRFYSRTIAYGLDNKNERETKVSENNGDTNDFNENISNAESVYEGEDLIKVKEANKDRRLLYFGGSSSQFSVRMMIGVGTFNLLYWTAQFWNNWYFKGVKVQGVALAGIF